jgi:hypothetical protein
MLVASSICFVLTATPSTVHSIYLSISKNLSNNQYIIHIYTNILLHFHHASNFLVFVFSCRRFRLELIELSRYYLRCAIYQNWYKRSSPNTEHIILYSTKQKTPIKLLSSKSNPQIKRNNQNGIVLLSMNTYHRRNGRPYGPCVQTLLK